MAEINFRGRNMRKILTGCVAAVVLMVGAAQAADLPAAGQPGSLEWAAAGAWRDKDKEVPRDAVRHPVEELKFMGLEPGMTVIEIYPGGGYFTGILGPVLKQGGGKLIEVGGTEEAANKFKEKFVDHPEIYGKLGYSVLSKTSGALAPAGSADLVVTFRNVHNWMEDGFNDKAFADFYKALKPGGLLGVEEHRGKAEGPQDPKAASGYVQEAFVKAAAEKAGFKFVKSSELLANPKDTKDYPFGVWTLPPTLLSSPDGKTQDPNFDQSKYIAIGEADNMLLVFQKPK
jgi:predicted methyltransferase